VNHTVNSLEHKSNKKLFAALLWTLFVTVLSLISFGSFASNIKIANKDKIVHFIFYFVMIILWLNYFMAHKINYVYLKVFLLISTYGVFIEICQEAFTKNRQADVYDALTNALGAFFGLVVLKTYISQKKMNNQNFH